MTPYDTLLNLSDKCYPTKREKYLIVSKKK